MTIRPPDVLVMVGVEEYIVLREEPTMVGVKEYVVPWEEVPTRVAIEGVDSIC